MKLPAKQVAQSALHILHKKESFLSSVNDVYFSAEDKAKSINDFSRKVVEPMRKKYLASIAKQKQRRASV